jgi:hypothetical protein
MKKRIHPLLVKKTAPFLLVLLLVVFAGCQKSTPANLSEVNAHVVDGGDPAADGLGLIIALDNNRETVVPINLPPEYQQKGINLPVAIKIVNTGKTTRIGNGTTARVIYLVSIRKL